MYSLVSIGPRPQCELSGESGWKIPPANDARLTIVDGMRGDEHLRYIRMINWVYQEVNYSQRLVSIYRTPLKVVLCSGEERWGRGSLIERGKRPIVWAVDELASGLVNTEACQKMFAPQIESNLSDLWERERGEEIGVGVGRRQHTIAGDFLLSMLI